MVAQAERFGVWEPTPVLDYIVLAQLQGFASLADQIGPPLAQEMLGALSARIGQSFAPASIGRVGHGVVEFSLSGMNRRDVAQRLETGLAAIAEPLEVAGEHFSLTVALGCARIDPAYPLSRSIARAEHALNAALTSDPKLVIEAEGEPDLGSDRFGLLRDLRSAISGGDLTLAHQPKLNVRTGKVDAVEALVRWRHATRGAVPPDDFIGLAEDTGDIGALTRAVLHRAVADRQTLVGHGFDVPIYVNLSGQLLSDEPFCRWVLETCADAPGGIGLEITETAIIADPERALGNLAAFAQAGVPIAIDDYGSGLSSLFYLQMLPASELKIDKTFISGLASSQRGPLIVRSTIDLAHALEMEVTAEGVDDPFALALLKVMGCDRVQGFHVSPPLPLVELIEFLRANAERNLSDVVTTPLRMNSGK